MKFIVKNVPSGSLPMANLGEENNIFSDSNNECSPKESPADDLILALILDLILDPILDLLADTCTGVSK